MINIILYTTLIGSLIIGLLGKYIGILWSRIIIILSVIISLISCYILYYDIMIENKEYSIYLMNWIKVDYLIIDYGFILNKITISVLLAIITISSLVHIYGIMYMEHDPHQQRFLSYLSLFTFGMIILVAGENLLILFIGWELIGVTSYLLISFWNTRISAGKSGLNALLMNRFGDKFLVIGLSLIVYVIGNLNYDVIFSLNSYIDIDILYIILLCFLIGSSSKSVQFGLHSWLLNSMEGWFIWALIKFHYMLKNLYIKIYKIYWS